MSKGKGPTRTSRVKAVKNAYLTVSRELKVEELVPFLLDSNLDIYDAEKLESLLQADPSLVDEPIYKASIGSGWSRPIALSESILATYFLLKYGADPNALSSQSLSSPLWIDSMIRAPQQLDLLFRFGASVASASEADKPSITYNTTEYPETLNTFLTFNPSYPSKTFDPSLDFDEEGYNERSYSSLKLLVDRGWKIDDEFFLEDLVAQPIFYLLLNAMNFPKHPEMISNGLLEDAEFTEDTVDVLMDTIKKINTLNSIPEGAKKDYREYINYPFEVLRFAPVDESFWAAKYYRDFGQPIPWTPGLQAYRYRYTMPRVKIGKREYTLSLEKGRGVGFALLLLAPDFTDIGTIYICGKPLSQSTGRDTLLHLFGLEAMSQEELLVEGYDKVYPQRVVADTIIGYKDELVQAIPAKNYSIYMRDYHVQFNSLEFLEGVAILCKEAGLELGKECRELIHWKYD